MNKNIISTSEEYLSNRIQMLTLTTEICKIYAEDESEVANIDAIDAFKYAFHADEAALFYVNGQKQYKICLPGTVFPISIAEERWKSCLLAHTGKDMVVKFKSWSLPVIEKELNFWVSACLYLSEDEGCYILLGKDHEEWDKNEIEFLDSISKTIASIMKTRHERGIEEFKKKEIEQKLIIDENRLRDLFEGSRDMIYTVDSNDLITTVNVAGTVLLGHGSKNEILGRAITSFYQDVSSRIHILKKLAENGYIDDFEVILVKKDGSNIFCSESAHVLRDEKGNISEIQGIVKDITQRIENERNIWRMNLELAEANKNLKNTQLLMVQQEKLASIGQLAAGVAHEINNPLGFLISNHKNLEKYFNKIKATWNNIIKMQQINLVSDVDIEAVSNIFIESASVFAESKDGFERIKTIVSNLKNFSRIDHCDDYTLFDINAGIESTLVVASNEIKYVANIEKHLALIPEIKAKGNQLNQVFLNIIVNAAQAIGSLNKQNKGLIIITTKQDGESILISVKDNGSGIKKEVLNKIFDPFFTTKEPGKGTGLGLSISYDIIVTKHSGKIWVESELGKGSTFYISLPIQRIRESVCE